MQENNCDNPVERKEFNCGVDKQVFKHQHVVKYKHDIINEYDVIHEHEYNYYDVVKNREVVKRNDHTTYKPNYCCGYQNCGVENQNFEDERQDCDCQ